ncbi:transposable element Tcb1 transposase [Trichonephila clavipes]|nr:transposable element Tcb1 transposase [Trichonephila clavipes]
MVSSASSSSIRLLGLCCEEVLVTVDPKEMSFKRRPGSGHPRQISHRKDRHSQHTSSTAGLMVCVAIAYNTWLPLVLICGTMTTQWYVHDIQQPNVLLLMRRLPGAIFEQDNARRHTASVSQDCLRTVSTLSWPARSPDLSPKEHIWNHLGL